MELCTVSDYIRIFGLWKHLSVFNFSIQHLVESEFSQWGRHLQRTRECTKFKQIYYLTFKGKNWAKNQVRDKCDKKDDENDKIEWQKEKRPSIHTNTCIHIIYSFMVDYGWITVTAMNGKRHLKTSKMKRKQMLNWRKVSFNLSTAPYIVMLLCFSRPGLLALNKRT